jgi:hypothetical protein
VPFVLIPKLLSDEGTDFQRIEKRWRPTDLLFVAQTRALLRDMAWRYGRLSEAESELASLDRGSIYVKLLRRMRLWLRRAHYTWKADHLSFTQTVAGFYTDYGAVLRLLKIDEARGKFADRSVKQGV